VIDEIVFTMITVLVLLFAAFERPTRLHAPRDWYFEGIRPDGETTLKPNPPLGCGEPTGTAAEQRPCPDDHRAIGARIYCTGGSVPIVVDDQTVGCTRRFQ
jgi:hypothetical protein